MTIDEKLILPGIRLIEYLDTHDKTVPDYRIEGVHYSHGANNGASLREHFDIFLKKIPKGTEAVVNYERTLVSGDGVAYCLISGLALIPKDYKESSEKKQDDQDKKRK